MKSGPGRRPPQHLPPLSTPEIRHLLARLVLAIASVRELLLEWSLWRRRYHAAARAAHLKSYQKKQL
jgi:hypothetical protein